MVSKILQIKKFNRNSQVTDVASAKNAFATEALTPFDKIAHFISKSRRQVEK